MSTVQITPEPAWYTYYVQRLFQKGNVRVYGALIVGGALVAGAFVVKQFGLVGVPAPNTEPTLENSAAVVVGPYERQYIQTYDSDGDGLRDWEEALLGNEEPIIINASTTYTPPDTLTGEFGVEFFTQVAEVQTLGDYAPENSELVNSTLATAELRTRETLYTKNDIIILPSSEDADLRVYANAVGRIMEEGPNPNAEQEAIVFRDALFAQDQERLDDLIPIAENYQTIRDRLRALPVPEALATEHLNLVNIFQIMFTNVESMRLAFDDPLLAMFRVQRYEGDAQGLYYVFQNLLLAVAQRNIVFNEAEPGFALYAFTPTGPANQAIN